MKKIIALVLIVLSNINCKAQIVDINSGFTTMDAPVGTYIKDLNNQFGPFLGVWKYQNGNEILLIKLEKVEMYLDSEYGTYQDFIKGNYSYTTDGGTTYVVNTIQENLGNNNPMINPLYSSGPDTPIKDRMSFYDVVYQKDAYATFIFQNNIFNQIYLKLENKSNGVIYPDSPPNSAFSIPTNIILTKQ